MSEQKAEKVERQFDHNRAWQSVAVADGYDQRRFSSLGGRAYDAMEKRCISILLDRAEASAQVDKVLEVACGTGRISELLATRGFELTCGDISEQMLDTAKSRLHPLTQRPIFTSLDIYNLGPFESEYDCVCCFRLFQHLASDEREKALRQMAKASRRFVLLNVMYTSVYYGMLRKLRRVLGRYTTRYTSSETEIIQELEFAGLRKIACKFSQPGFNGNLILLLEKI